MPDRPSLPSVRLYAVDTGPVRGPFPWGSFPARFSSFCPMNYRLALVKGGFNGLPVSPGKRSAYHYV